jgi:hypothetical protein
MNLSRLALVLGIALGLVPACASGGSSGDGPGDGGQGGEICTATVLCGGGITYKECMTNGTSCVIQYSTGLSIPCGSVGADPCTQAGDGPDAAGPLPDGGPPGEDVVEPADSSGGSPDTGGGEFDSGGGFDTGGGADSVCGTAPTADECATCCGTHHAEGDNTYVNAVGECVCVSPGVCASECASDFCVMMDPGPECNSCIEASLGPSGACVSQVSGECGADPDCIAYVDCANDECSSLP